MSRRHPHSSGKKKNHRAVSLAVTNVDDEDEPPEAEEKPLPKLPAYDKKTFWKIDWRSLSADLALVAFGFAIHYDYFNDSDFFRHVSQEKTLGIYILAVIMICWFMGFTLGRFRVYYGKTVNKIAGWVIAVAMLTLLGYMMAIVVGLGADETKAGTFSEHFAMFASFMIVLGPLFSIGGYMTSTQVILMGLPRRNSKDELSPDEAFYGSVLTIIVAIAGLVWGSMSDPVQNSSVSFLWIILILFGSALAGCLALVALILVKRFLILIRVYNRVAISFEIAFPFLIISALVFWNEVQQYYLSDFSHTGRLGILFFTGILPFRLLLVFNPPLKAINLLIGIASLVFFIFSTR
jgi:hypothetical protein